MDQNKNKSYRQILRSTSIFGGAQIINILIGIVRNKLTAIILGSVGIGLISIYQSTLDLIKSFSTLGIGTSGVREIAQANKNKEDLILTISAIRKWILIFSITGTVICIVASPLISKWIFDTSEHKYAIVLLSVCVFFSTMAAGEVIILQGLREISYMVKASMLWNICGLVITVLFYWIWGIQSIIPVFIIVSIITFLSYIYFRQKLNLKTAKIDNKLFLKKGKNMLRIGAYIVIAAIQTELTLFIVKTYIINHSGLDSLGLVQATRTISSVYLTLILGAMGADFYPRLSSVIGNNSKIRQLINEQVHILILISTPIIIILLLVSKFILLLLYSSSFESATSLLNWRILGLLLKIVSWVFGLTLLAKGKGFIFLLTDTLYSIVYLLGCYFLFPHYGVDSIGISFSIGYIIYLTTVYMCVFKTCNFRWKRYNVQNGVLAILAIAVIFYVSQYQRNFLLYIGIPLSIVSATYSIYKLNHIISFRSILNKFTKNSKEN